MGANFRMGACTLECLWEVEMGAYIHGVLILYGCLLLRFYGISEHGDVSQLL